MHMHEYESCTCARMDGLCMRIRMRIGFVRSMPGTVDGGHFARWQVGNQSAAHELEEVVVGDRAVLVLIDAQVGNHLLKMLHGHSMAEGVHEGGELGDLQVARALMVVDLEDERVVLELLGGERHLGWGEG